MTDTDGGPAFPTDITAVMNLVVGSEKPDLDVHPGMSLRDWYAGQALIGVIVGRMLCLATGLPPGMDDEKVAKLAMSTADAMLEARKSNDLETSSNASARRLAEDSAPGGKPS